MTSIPGGGTVLQQFPGGGGGNSKFHTTSPSSPLMQHLPFLGMIQQNNGKFGESKVNCDDSSLVKFDNNISSLEEDHCGNNDDHSMSSDRFRLLLFNHKNTMMNNTTIHLHNHNSSSKNTSLNQEHVISKGFIKIGGEKQPTQKNNHDRVDNYFGKVNKEHGMADIDSIIKPKWLKPIVENQCDHKENRKFTKKYMDNFANINKKENSVKSKKIPKETNDSTRTNVKRKVVEKSEKTFNSVMLELFKERSTEMIDHNSNEEKTIESMYTRLTKAWNRFIFWWTKWKRDFTSNTIHQFLNSYDPVMRTFECIFLFFETFRIPYPIQYIVHRIRHFFYLMFQFVWTSAFLFEDNSEFERELLSHNNLRNDSQIYNSDPRYYYDDVNYYSQN